MVDFGMDLQSNLDAPRAFAGMFSGKDGLRLETTHSQATFDALTALGHAAHWSDEALGGAQAIHIGEDGVLIGAGAKVLGNITVGRCSRIAAGSVVLAEVPPCKTVAGVPARIVGEAGCDQPAISMDQRFSE